MTELQIEYFQEVARESSYTKAAKNLHVTQPSISYQIRLLEKELGLQLFWRSGKSKMSLTPAGSIVLEEFQKMQESFQTALERAAEVSEHENLSLRVGFVEAWDIPELMQAVEQSVHKQYPLARVYCETYTFKELRERIASNELDVILIVRTNLVHLEGLELENVNETTATLYYSSNHPFSANELTASEQLSPSQKVYSPPLPLTLSDFKQQPYYVLPDDETPFSRDQNHAYMLAHMVNPKIIELPNRDSILLAISSNYGYAIFDSWTRYRKIEGISAMPLDFTMPVCAVKRQNNHNPLIQIFIDEAKKFKGETL